MLFFLIAYAYPAIRFNGFEFLTSQIWNIGNQYGSGVDHAQRLLGPSRARRSAHWCSSWFDRHRIAHHGCSPCRFR